MPLLVHELDSDVLFYSDDHSLLPHQRIHVVVDLGLKNHDLALLLSQVDLILNCLLQEALVHYVDKVWNFLA